jgi:hypothetical protein
VRRDEPKQAGPPSIFHPGEETTAVLWKLSNTLTGEGHYFIWPRGFLTEGFATRVKRDWIAFPAEDGIGSRSLITYARKARREK